MATLDEMFSGKMFIVGHGKSSGASHELIVRDGKIYAVDAFLHKLLQAGDAMTPYGIIMPSDGGLTLFSKSIGKWIKCTDVDGVYSIKNLMEDVKKYNL